MKISRLTIAGFGPYKTEQHVDFDRFDDDGIFLISGKTGSGKSSILDAICYAFYGSVPRYDGTLAQLRSDHAEATDPTFVELEFSVDDTRYRVRRVPEFERPKARGEGTTKQSHEATLWVLRADGWEGIAAKPVDVGRELARILMLNKEQFLQVILLAQNRFQDFLLARNDDRQAVLRTLFGTKRFQDIEVELDGRRKALAASLVESEQSLGRHARRIADLQGLEEAPVAPDLDGIAEAETSIARLLTRATEEAALADTAFTAADTEHRGRVEIRTLQERRDAAAATVARLALDSHARDADRLAIATAHRAATVRPLSTAHAAADAALADALRRSASARADYAPLEPDGDRAIDDVISTTAATLGALVETLAEESGLPTLEAEVAVLAESLDSQDAALDELTALSTALPGRITVADEQIAAATLVVGRGADATAALARVTAAHTAAVSAAALESLLTSARGEEKSASSASLAASMNLDLLLERRLDGFAGDLALALLDGEACAVCGSTSHPSPAERSHEPVGEADVDAARARFATASRELADTTENARTIAMRAATEAGRADGKSVEELDRDIVALGAVLAEAGAAERVVATVTLKRETLRSLLASSAEELVAGRQAREEILRRLTARQTSLDALSTRVAAHRAEFATIADRVVRLTATAAAARAVAEAEAAVASRTSALAAAAESLAAQVAAQKFASALESTEARLTDEAIAALEARIRDHDDSVATARATVADAAAASIPQKLVDVELARAARDESSVARDVALAARSTAEHRARELAKVAAEARGELATSTDRRAEYDQVRELAAVVAGSEPNEKRMRLESFVLAAQLEEIVAAANLRLHRMTGGRFALEHDDALQFRGARSGLSLAIRDEHTGRSRATHSLSGGETFLASLALALGLAEVVTNQAGGIRLDTLFVDEGFGSLDGDTLEIAMTTLDGLRAGGRTIGLISHVEAMKEQIPAKLLIKVTDKGHSEIA